MDVTVRGQSNGRGYWPIPASGQTQAPRSSGGHSGYSVGGLANEGENQSLEEKTKIRRRVLGLDSLSGSTPIDLVDDAMDVGITCVDRLRLLLLLKTGLDEESGRLRIPGGAFDELRNWADLFCKAAASSVGDQGCDAG